MPDPKVAHIMDTAALLAHSLPVSTRVTMLQMHMRLARERYSERVQQRFRASIA